MAGDTTATTFTAREQRLRSDRSNWDNLWQQTTIFTLPKEATYTSTVTPGQERTRALFDSTAPRSLELFASFLHTLMNNPAQQWFSIGIENKTNSKTAIEHNQWFETTAVTMLNKMVTAKIYEHLHQAFMFLGCVGTACVYVEWFNGLQIRHFHMQNVVIQEGENGEVDTVFRQFFLTPRQARQRWRERAGVTEKDDKTPDEKIRFLHVVVPTSDPGLGEMADTNAPFASLWINTKSGTVVSSGHYEEMPYMVPRWYQTGDGEVYGRGPAMGVMPSIRMANRLQETLIRGSEKLADPPLLIPDGGMLSPVRMFPGGITHTDGQVKVDTLIPPGASRIDLGNVLLERTQTAIERGFFVQLFIDPDTSVKTATQVLQEADERQRAISPMVMRIQAEMYDPLIRRVFNVLFRNGQLPDPPPGLTELTLKIEYISPLVASQRQVEGLSLLRMYEGLVPWADVDPGTFDRFDTDEIALVMHRSSGAPSAVLRTNAEVKKLRQARLEREQQETQMVQTTEGADAAAKLISATSK